MGKTLNSTGLVMYSDTSSTTTDMVMLVLISRSSSNDGSGVTIASTMARTATGTPIWPHGMRLSKPATLPCGGWFSVAAPADIV